MSRPSTLVQCSVCRLILRLAGEYTSIYIHADWDTLSVSAIVFCTSCSSLEKTKRLLLNQPASRRLL